MTSTRFTLYIFFFEERSRKKEKNKINCVISTNVHKILRGKVRERAEDEFQPGKEEDVHYLFLFNGPENINYRAYKMMPQSLKVRIAYTFTAKAPHTQIHSVLNYNIKIILLLFMVFDIISSLCQE